MNGINSISAGIKRKIVINDHILNIIPQPPMSPKATMTKPGLISSNPPMNSNRRFGEKIHVTIFMVPRSVMHRDIRSTSRFLM